MNQIVLQQQEQPPGLDMKNLKSCDDKISIERACVPSSTSPSLYFQAPNVGRGKSPDPSPNKVPNEKSCESEKVTWVSVFVG